MSAIILIGGGVLLLGIGIGLGYLLAYRLIAADSKAASDVQEELDAYRQHVTEHFGETAQHFQTLGQQYRSLYEHLAKGADALCDPAQSGNLLDFTAGNALPGTASNEVETDVAPDAPIDYVAEQEDVVTEPEPTVAPTEETETTEQLAADDEVVTESPAEETSTDQVVPPEPVEPERTVH